VGTSNTSSLNSCGNHLTCLSQYPFVVKENERYEEHLAATRPPGMFPFPWGKHKNRPLMVVPQDNVLWALRPEHSSTKG